MNKPELSKYYVSCVGNLCVTFPRMRMSPLVFIIVGVLMFGSKPEFSSRLIDEYEI